MFVLALDTTTRRGSVALAADDEIVDLYAGDPAITHGERLPGDVMRLLDRHHLAPRDVDLFAVASGPGSFTGLRIGIATMQGFALANGKDIIGISALDALHDASRDSAGDDLVTWMDAQRGEVFSARFRGDALIDGPSVETPAAILARWTASNGGGSHHMTFVGEGAIAYGDLITSIVPAATVLPDVPLLAPSIARLARVQSHRQGSAPPDNIRPLYIRRPDAELARDRKAGR